MSVKEVLQSLVDDNLVDTDKIGTSIYFWAYPSKAMHTVSLDHHLSFISVLFKSIDNNEQRMFISLYLHPSATAKASTAHRSNQ